MTAVALKADSVSANPSAKPQGNNGFDSNTGSSFSDLLADIGADSAANPTPSAPTQQPSQTPAKTPSPLKSLLPQSPADAATTTGDTTPASDVATLVGWLMGKDAPSNSAATEGSSIPTKHGETGSPKGDDTATPDPSAPATALPGLTTLLPTRIPSNPGPASTTLGASAAIADPTADAIAAAASTAAGGTTESLVAAATGGMTTSFDVSALQVADVTISSQVAPAMITPLSRSLAAVTGPSAIRIAASGAAAQTSAPDDDKASSGDADVSAFGGDDTTVATPHTASLDTLADAKVDTATQSAGPGTDAVLMMPAGAQAQNAPVDAVVEAVTTMAAQMPDPAITASSAIALARTMTLQITPGTSGTISIRMRLIGRGLDLKLSVSDPQTLSAISRERDTLSAALHDRSYTLDNLVIQGGDASASASGANHETMQQSAGGAGSQPDAGTGGQSRSSSGGGGDGTASRQPEVERNAPSARVAGSASGAVFV